MRRALPWAVAALGLALVVAGIAVARAADPPSSVTYGASYEPLLPADSAYESTLQLTFDDAGALWTTGDLVGAGLAVLGALVLAGAGGWALGRRSGRRSAAG